MTRIFVLTVFSLFYISSLKAQRYFTLSGLVKDSMGQSISGASIRLRNDNIGTKSNNDGAFELKLEEGYYEIVVSAIGYTNYSLNTPLKQNVFLTIILNEKQMMLREVEVSNKRHDPAWDIVQQVIANRNKINRNLINYKCDGYIKASDILIVDSAMLKKKSKSKKKQPLNIDSAEAEIKAAAQNIPNMNFAEVNLVKYWGKPSLIKEERLGVRLLGDKSALYFLSVTDGEFDFYKNQVELGKLSDVRYVSPFSPGANISYRYKLLGSYYEGSQKVYRIKITPRKVGNALFNGEAEVYDSMWILKSVSFSLNPNHIPLYTSFTIGQTYEITDSGYVTLKGQNFTYTKKAKIGQRNGQTTVHYSGYQTNLALGNRFFGNEVSVAFDSAYERDKDWWVKQRKDTLSKNEITFTHYRDSINLVRNSKAYLDSIDKIYNKVTPLKILWWGQGYINRDKKLRIEFAPLFTMIQPGMIGGFRAGYFVQFNKRFKNRQSITFNPYVNYGFLNEDLKGSLYLSHLYKPLKRSRYYVYAAREFQMINPNDAFINMFRRSNFYDQWRIQLGHTFEIVNGLYFSNYITYSDRKDISKYKFLEIGDSIFGLDNRPVTFDPHQSAEIKLILSYTPFQQYIREPKEKIILGSKYPTFSLIYNQGIPKLFGSDVNFSYMQGTINQTINYGRLGIGKYTFSTGKFFDTTYLPIVDYKYQRRGDPYLLTNPLGNFQLLPVTFPTFHWYLEAHYWHSFNGFLTSALPPLKRWNINASAGSSVLWAFENDTKHFEVYYGLNKVFKLIRETFKIGIYYANGVNNIGGYYQGFKISIEQYNVRDNSWAF
jgi:hypothetical protein